MLACLCWCCLVFSLYWMCKNPMLNINIDAPLGNPSHSARNESCFTVRNSFFFSFGWLRLMNSGTACTNCWKGTSDLSWLRMDRRSFCRHCRCSQKKKNKTHSSPLKKMQDSFFAPAKLSQTTQGLSLKNSLGLEGKVCSGQPAYLSPATSW